MTISIQPNNTPPEKLQPTGWLRYLSHPVGWSLSGGELLGLSEIVINLN